MHIICEFDDSCGNYYVVAQGYYYTKVFKTDDPNLLKARLVRGLRVGKPMFCEERPAYQGWKKIYRQVVGE